MSPDHTLCVTAPQDVSAERWLDVPGFPGYQVSDTGRFRSRRPKNGHGPLADDWRLITGNRTRHGYWRVALCDGKKTVAARLHQVVLLAFVGPRQPGQEGCHNNGDRDNNCLKNLRWGTPKDNAQDRMKHGNQPRGDRHASSRLTAEQVETIRKLGLFPRSAEYLADKFGVCSAAVKRVLVGQSWQDGPCPGVRLCFAPERLQPLAARKGWDMKQLRVAAGIGDGVISKLIHGKKRASWMTVLRLAAALEVEPTALCTEVEV